MKIDPRKVMQLYDGELEQSEAESVRRELAGDPEAQRVFQGFVEVGVAVRIWAEEAPRLRARASPRARARRRIGGAVWLGMAAAAALTALVSTKGREPSLTSRPPVSALALPAAAATETTAAEESLDEEVSADEPPSPDGAGAAIEMVDFGAGGGTIFVVSKGTEATPVVWLSDDPPDGQAKPL